MNKNRIVRENRSERSRRMVAEMSNARTLAWIGVAAVIHLAIIGGTSVGYIREHWFASKVGEPATPADQKPQMPTTAPSPVVAAMVKASDAQNPSVLPAGLSDDDKKLAARRDSPEVKGVTEAAKPGELPKGPQHNAFEIDDSPK